jgi:hypothetical protein
LHLCGIVGGTPSEVGNASAHHPHQVEQKPCKDVPSAPWHSVFKSERINDHHLTIEAKPQSQRYKDGARLG